MKRSASEDEVFCVGVRSPGGEMRPTPKAPKAPKAPKPSKRECEICYASKPVTEFKALPCLHVFCKTCIGKMRELCPLRCGDRVKQTPLYPNMIP